MVANVFRLFLFASLCGCGSSPALVDTRLNSSIKRLDIENVFEQLDLLAHLSVTRGNGLRAMVARIKEVAAKAPP